MTAAQKAEFASRKATSGPPTIPIKELPKVVDHLKALGTTPERRAQLAAHDAAMEEWRKSLIQQIGVQQVQAIAVSSATNAATTTTIVQGTPGPPGENKFLCPDNGQYYRLVPRLGNDGTTVTFDLEPV